MPVSPSEQCTEIVVTYQGLARYQHRCQNRARGDGLCGVHLRASKGPEKVTKPAGGPPEVTASTTVVLKWEPDQAPIFTTPHSSAPTAWTTMEVSVQHGKEDIDSSLRATASGRQVKKDGSVGQVKVGPRYLKVSKFPEETQEQIFSAVRFALGQEV